jgi:CubicO group peptidase (beta-lactamase class C family)
LAGLLAGLLAELAVALALVPGAHAGPDRGRLADLVANEVTSRGYPGMAMLAQRATEPPVAAAAGYSDLAAAMPLQTDDPFHLASVTKAFTAVAVLQLVDTGRLRLDSTLAGLLGDAVRGLPYADTITVAQLLDHSSGIYATNNDPDYLKTLLGPGAGLVASPATNGAGLPARHS